MGVVKSDVQGRWSSDEGMELSGSRADLSRLASHLMSATERLTIILAKLSNEMIMPYEGGISHVIVHIKPGEKLRIARIDHVMELRGDTSNLCLFAQNIVLPDDELLSPIYHIHIEFFPGHFFLAPGSEPLVVSPSTIPGRMAEQGGNRHAK